MPGSNLLSAVSAAPKILYSGQLAATTDATLYTVPTSGSTVIKHGTVCNISASSVTITAISVVPSGGTASGVHRVVSGYVLAANDTLSLTDYLAGCCLSAGDSIHAQAATAAALDIIITGVENS